MKRGSEKIRADEEGGFVEVANNFIKVADGRKRREQPTQPVYKKKNKKENKLIVSVFWLRWSKY
jgi:hypothetical protein